MEIISVDVHEGKGSSSIILDILNRTLNVVRAAHEPLGFADFWWASPQGIIMWERKQGRELLSCIGNKLDVQLRKYVEAWPTAHIGILQEGRIYPTEQDKCRVIQANGKSKIVDFPFTAFRAYQYQRLTEGFLWLTTESGTDTALTLASMVYSSHKKDHEGLREFEMPIKSISKKNKNPQQVDYIRILSSIRGIGISTATTLVKEYGLSPRDVVNADKDDLVNIIGLRAAEAILRGIG
jgi:hypothetical protein